MGTEHSKHEIMGHLLDASLTIVFYLLLHGAKKKNFVATILS